MVAHLHALWREMAEAREMDSPRSDDENNAWCERENEAYDRLAHTPPQSPTELAEKMGACVKLILEYTAWSMSETDILALENLVADARRIAAEFQPMPSREVH